MRFIQETALADCQRRPSSQDTRFFEIAHAVITAPEVERLYLYLRKTYRFTDINYKVASREDKETMFLAYSELLNGLDSAATTKLTICNRRQNQADFEQSVLMAMRGDGLDKYRKEYNQMLIDKATGANGIIQEKLVTVTVYKRDIEDARAYFTRIGADLTARFAALGSKCVELDAADRLRILHDFYRAGERGAGQPPGWSYWTYCGKRAWPW